MTEPIQAFLSLGSNLGDPASQIHSALNKMRNHPLISVERLSALYQTEPVDAPGQSDFINCAVELSTNLNPESLLAVCLEIEEQSGRIRSGKKNAPRTLDIDIIFYGDVQLDTNTLRIPHPRYMNRRFVLEPLAEIAPNFICPDTGFTSAEALNHCGDRTRVELLESEVLA